MSVQNHGTVSQSTCAPENGAVEASQKKSKAELAHLASVVKALEAEVAQAKANATAAASAPDARDADQPSSTGAAQNFMFALMEAISRDQSSMSQMQITDALTTQLSVTIEQSMNNAWYAPHDTGKPGSGGILSNDANELQQDIANKDSANVIQAAQSKYNIDSATAQANISQQDGSVQGAQGQTSSDGTNLQNKAQMAQTPIGINSSLTNMINGSIIA